ncbi:MAG: hypothetical protein UX28_C0003G0068 [Candidatus Pacebacteria bacterium GW2011_GWA1_46_10]|nr:MAG: hypothetical protein UX28_C0003G0068 [Candidatus Pacebacteria bacterium GW2011_GWA1_46_10]HCR80877.1 hypothetical protein [Candidatus Paceibacterota bacterium]
MITIFLKLSFGVKKANDDQVTQKQPGKRSAVGGPMPVGHDDGDGLGRVFVSRVADSSYDPERHNIH